jgi:hypothetical protein
MGNFDFTGDKRASPGRSDLVWNVGTAVALLATLCMSAYFAMVFFNPQTALNPFRPPTLPPMLVTPTSTWTLIPLPATWTPTISIEPSITLTRRPTITPIPSTTPFVFPTNTPKNKPTNTPKPTSTPKPVYPFNAAITYFESTVVHPESQCNWLGVGGTVSDLKNNPVFGLVIHLAGSLSGKSVDMLTVSNTNPLYGQSGFEFVLGDKPIASKNTLYLQLLDQAGLPLSDKIYFTTYDDCSKNLVIIRFKQVK